MVAVGKLFPLSSVPWILHTYVDAGAKLRSTPVQPYVLKYEFVLSTEICAAEVTYGEEQ